jgi:hypothetical protein
MPDLNDHQDLIFIAALGISVFTAIGTLALVNQHRMIRAEQQRNVIESQAVEFLSAIAKSSTFSKSDKEQAARGESLRRKITNAEEKWITGFADCRSVAYVGYDNQIHPDYCRPGYDGEPIKGMSQEEQDWLRRSDADLDELRWIEAAQRAADKTSADLCRHGLVPKNLQAIERCAENL